MVKKLQASPSPTLSRAQAGEENEAWKANDGSQVSAVQPTTESAPAEPNRGPSMPVPGQQTLTDSPPVEPVEAAPAPTDLQLLPKELGGLFAKRPLVLGEAAPDYDELLSRIMTAVKPTDTIETLWAKDVADLMWEAQRYRRIKAGLLMQAGRQALTDHLAQVKDAGKIEGERQLTVSKLVAAYVEGNSTAVAEVSRILHSRGFDIDMLMAQALTQRLADVERVDRLIASADARRNRALSEIDRRRDAFARRLRMAAHDVIDIVEPRAA